MTCSHGCGRATVYTDGTCGECGVRAGGAGLDKRPGVCYTGASLDNRTVKGARMLQRDVTGAMDGPLKRLAFCLDVEVDEAAKLTPAAIANKLGDALMWVEGCGEVNVNYIGTIDVVEYPAFERNSVNG